MPEQPRARPAKTAKQAIDEHAPWRPAPYQPADASAIQALVRGDAAPHMQQRALAFIINGLCGAYDQPYRPGGIEAQRDTDFALGKQWVGQQLVRLTKVRIIPEGEQP